MLMSVMLYLVEMEISMRRVASAILILFYPINDWWDNLKLLHPEQIHLLGDGDFARKSQATETSSLEF